MPRSTPPIRGSQLGTPKWKEVLEGIEQKITAGDFQTGRPFLTLGELSRQYGVSDITARRVFRELKSQGLIVTRGRRGTFIAPREQRQSVFMCIRSGESAHTGGLAEDSVFFRNFLAEFHRSRLDQRFEVKPISVDFCLRNLSVVSGYPLFVTLEAILRFDGERVVVDHERLDRLREHCTVIVFRSLPGIIDGVNQVSRNLHDGIRQAVDHLVGRGHRHMGMLCGRLASVWFKPRFEGFLAALSDAGLPCDPRLVEITSGLDQEEDFAAVERLLSQHPKPTAIVCGNDGRALHVLEYCRLHGIAVPDELAVTGLDNTLEASLSSPALSSVDHRDDELVREMFRLVEKNTSKNGGQPEHVVISPRMVVRNST